MPSHMHWITLLIVLAPLLGAILSGFIGRHLHVFSHRITIFLMVIAFGGSLWLLYQYFFLGMPAYDVTLYRWVTSGLFHFNVGFLVDRLSVVMMVCVTFVSLMVHVYTIGYMKDDPGYARFFSYVSLFTFAMLCLVLADNFMLLFFGWEGVGLVSYLLIGFWFHKANAVSGSLKAFLVNRIGDVGFVLGVAAILTYFGDLNYLTVFAHTKMIIGQTITVLPMWHWQVSTVICLLLFVGAMGKSAQMPLHVWLPESMEGPTPISALIHAATMVTAGVYMVARLSPLFELSTTALSVVMILGASTCLFMGLLAVFHYDIKRVIAYSTLSQLGYMMAALGASAYAAGLFHLFTHACFKALLFLAAGSVIIALHHEQDMRRMGGLARALPITYATFLVGALALSAIPPFSGFYSKDSIIEAVSLSTIPGALYAYVCVLAGAFITALYTFRMVFLTFHGESRLSPEALMHVKESPKVMTVPLILLAIPSFCLGFLLVNPLLHAAFPLLGNTLFVSPQHAAFFLSAFQSVWTMTWRALLTLPFWFAIAGIVVAWIFILKRPQWSDYLKQQGAVILNVFARKYGFDDVNHVVAVRGTIGLSRWLFKRSDTQLIDETLVNGSGHVTLWLSSFSRSLQTGYLYHYLLVMIVGLLFFLCWFLLG